MGVISMLLSVFAISSAAGMDAREQGAQRGPGFVVLSIAPQLQARPCGYAPGLRSG
jgi:hypothetical protein